jgi:hypothetical protein
MKWEQFLGRELTLTFLRMKDFSKEKVGILEKVHKIEGTTYLELDNGQFMFFVNTNQIVFFCISDD